MVILEYNKISDIDWYMKANFKGMFGKKCKIEDLSSKQGLITHMPLTNIEFRSIFVTYTETMYGCFNSQSTANFLKVS